MGKGHIGWKRKTEDGERTEIYAHYFGHRWIFYSRAARFDDWEPFANPPLEDWLTLLEAVERLIVRRRMEPNVADRLRAEIIERFPGTKF